MLNRSQNKIVHLQKNISLYYEGRQYSAHVSMKHVHAHRHSGTLCEEGSQKLLFIITNIGMA
jgi:hypothetical protein